MNNIESIPLVAIHAYKTKLDGIDNEKLIEEIRTHDGSIAEHYLQNKHHTYYEDQRYPFGRPESEKLIETLTTAVSQIVGRNMVLEEIWTLTLQKGNSVAWHSHKSNTHLHPEEFFSIAYYPNAQEGSADLIFTTTACNTLEQSTIIQVSTGTLVVFNSFVTHMTSRHLLDEERVVISANFSPAQPSNAPTQDWTAYSRPIWSEYEKKLNAYDQTFIAKAHTPFGEESYMIGLRNDGTGEVTINNNIQSFDSYTLADALFETSFSVNVPMTTTVAIRFAIDSTTNTIDGLVKIGDFLACALTGEKVK